MPTAKELHEMQRTIREHGLCGSDFDGNEEETILRALSLLASVEDAEGIVRELREWNRIYGHALGPTYTQMNDRSAALILALKGQADALDALNTSQAHEISLLQAELASVKAHAEAMAAVIEPAAVPWGNIALEAYRAAHPKDAP